MDIFKKIKKEWDNIEKRDLEDKIINRIMEIREEIDDYLSDRDDIETIDDSCLSCCNKELEYIELLLEHIKDRVLDLEDEEEELKEKLMNLKNS